MRRLKKKGGGRASANNEWINLVMPSVALKLI